MNTKQNAIASQMVNAETKYRSTVAVLEDAFTFFERELWFKPRNLTLPMPVITIQSRMQKSGTLG